MYTGGAIPIIFSSPIFPKMVFLGKIKFNIVAIKNKKETYNITSL